MAQAQMSQSISSAAEPPPEPGDRTFTLLRQAQPLTRIGLERRACRSARSASSGALCSWVQGNGRPLQSSR